MPDLCVIPGDGIGKEVIPAAVAVLEAALPGLRTIYAQAGWGCFLEHGVSVPQSTLDDLKACGAGLFGAVSSPAYAVNGYRSAILAMRQELDLYANIRPVRSWPRISPRQGLDLIIVRENSEGLDSGRERLQGEEAVAERVITKKASLRIAKKTTRLANELKREKVTIVHKANVLPITDGLFRDTVRENLVGNFIVDELLVDVAAYKMVGEPETFDMVVTTNLFGDILSDAAAFWGGGLGMAPSLNWGDQTAIAEPVHGSAPDIAGKGIANPIAAILSAALLARHIWGEKSAADQIESAVYNTLTHLNSGILGTEEMTELVIRNL